MVTGLESNVDALDGVGPRRLRILWALPRPLEPLDTGGKIRTWNMLRYLAADHDVTVVGLQPEHEGIVHDLIPRVGRDLFQGVTPIAWSEPVKGSFRFWAQVAGNVGSPHSFVMAKYRSVAMSDWIRSAVAEGGFDVVVADFLHITRSVPRTAIPRVVFQHNVESMIRQRHYREHGWGPTRAYLAWEWYRMSRWEARVCRDYEGIIAVSEEDAAFFRDRMRARRVWAVPTGVDDQFFSPEGERAEPGWDLVFSGSMDWEANSSGVRWFLERVLPLIRASRPGTTLGVIGRNPPDWLRELSEEAGGVTVTGRVEDIRPYVRAGKVYVVPIRFGGGTRIKIFEAIAMGLPVVSTPIGAEGLGLEDGRHVRLGESPEALSSAVLEILGDADRAGAMAREARGHVLRNNSWRRVSDLFGDALQAAIREGS